MVEAYPVLLKLPMEKNLVQDVQAALRHLQTGEHGCHKVSSHAYADQQDEGDEGVEGGEGWWEVVLFYFLEKLFFGEFDVVHFDHDNEEEKGGQSHNGDDSYEEEPILRHNFFNGILVSGKGILLESWE